MSAQVTRRPGILLFIIAVQGLLFLAHALVFVTVNHFQGNPGIPHLFAFFVLVSISFVPASLLVWRYTHFFAWAFYRVAAIWLGCLSFFFWTSVLCWVVWAVIVLIARPNDPAAAGPVLLEILFGLATLASVAALINASWVRVRRVTVKLTGLPEVWKNRTLVQVSDLHLGPVRGYRFSRRVAKLAASLRPDVLVLTGDFYDGTAIDAVQMASAWKDFPARLGSYYVTGNHEEFSDRTKYLRAIESAGIRILRNEKVVIDGLQIAGILYGEGSERGGFLATVASLKLDSSQPSILLNHVPHFLDVGEEAGVSLQLSGHTHEGQMIPWNWVARRVHGPFVYGLNTFKRMLVYTTSGTGTWGPPMRLGTASEIVQLTFQ
jgi:predicted MPP superfamily phosphohydrolase